MIRPLTDKSTAFLRKEMNSYLDRLSNRLDTKNSWLARVQYKPIEVLVNVVAMHVFKDVADLIVGPAGGLINFCKFVFHATVNIKPDKKEQALSAMSKDISRAGIVALKILAFSVLGPYGIIPWLILENASESEAVRTKGLMKHKQIEDALPA